MAPSLTNGLVVPGHYFPIAYAIIVGLGLVMSLVMGMRLHFTEIVKTHCKTAEYWPSISATTGDFAPERFIWRTAFVLCALFRFTTGFLTFKFFSQQEAQVAVRASSVVSTRGLVLWEFACELLRCASAIGWTIISSGEDNLHHNASFAVYMIVGFVLQATQVVIVDRLRGTYSGSSSSLSLKKKCLIGQSLMAMCVGFFYTRHHQTCAPGAYSRSTMCEWAFAFFNILFDASQAYELVNERVSFGTSIAGGEPHVLNLASAPSNTILWVSDLFFGYMSVSLTLALFQHVYFVPMVAMAFTWEVALVIGVGAPLLYHVRRIRDFLDSRRFFGVHSHIVFYFLTIASLFSFDVHKDQGAKIWSTSIGTISLLMAQFGRVYLHNPSRFGSDNYSNEYVNEQRHISFSLPLGFALSMIIRILFVSLDPMQTNAMYNGFLGLVFGSWCAYIQYRRATYGKSSGAVVEDGDRSEGTPATDIASLYNVPPQLLGLCLGGIMVSSLAFVSSSGFIGRLLAIEPWPSGFFVVLAYLAGLYLSNKIVALAPPSKAQKHNSRTLILLLILGGWFVLTYATRQSNRSFEKHHAHYPTDYDTPRENVNLSDWVTEEEFRGSKLLAFVGGLMIAFGLGACWPAVMQYCVSHYAMRHRQQKLPLLKTMELPYMLVVSAALLAHVYVVCFPFVPGGFLLRDRLDAVLIVGLLLFVCPLLLIIKRIQASTAVSNSDASTLHSMKCRTPSGALILSVVLLLLLASAGRIITAPDSNSVPVGLTTMADKLADTLSVAKELVTYELQLNKFEEPRLSKNFRDYNVNNIGEKLATFKSAVTQKLGSDVLYAAEQSYLFTAMIWTVHFAMDNRNKDSTDRMVSLIRETKAGVIGLLESDSIRIQTANRDLVEYIAYQLGYEYTDYGPTTYDNTFGCALITKYPINYVKRYILPSPLGELACLIHAKLDILGVETNVYVGHWGNTQHWADGVLQSEFLGKIIHEHPGPSVFLGYLVTKPEEGNYKLYASETEAGKLRDTALQLYKKHPWKRLTQLGGYVEEVNEEDKKLPLVDQQYHRPPEGADPRYYFFEDTERYSTAHPRWEFVDRYCQYILYKSGLAKDEKPENANKLQPYYFDLVDWWRVLDIHDLSDTEIQVVQLTMKPADGK